MPYRHYQDPRRHQLSSSKRRAPYLIAAVGMLFAIALWYVIYTGNHHLTLLDFFFPWIILALGITIAVLLAVATRLIHITQQRAELYALMDQDFQKEISERIHAEETKQKLEKALLQGQKLQAIGTLAGGIAHDFNNILYAIVGYVEMAREDVANDSLVYKNLGKVLEASHRGQDLIAQILAFSRRQHHEFQPIQIKDTIEGVLALLKPTIPASVTIDFITMQNENFMILGNQTQLHQVIVNIINNAVDAMDGEGKVTIRLSEVYRDDELLKQFPQTVPSNYCKIDITDQGHGMDQSTIERIFEPFFTTKEVGKGTGLGLATAHTIVKEHQGEIIVDSQLGHGTTFTLLFPEFSNKEHAHGNDSLS